MTISNEMADVMNKFLNSLPEIDSFDLTDEYEKFKSQLLTTNEGQTIQYVSVLSGDKILKAIEHYKYVLPDSSGRHILVAEGLAARRWGHFQHRARLQDIQDGEWYKTSLAKRQYEDYPNVVKRSQAAIIISIIAIVLSAIGLWLKQKCQ